MRTRAVFFDVDFTLIYPGPAFQGVGYEAFCARHAITVDPARFPAAVVAAAPILDTPDTERYSHELFVAYTRRIIEGMGGSGPRLDACAAEIYEEWALCHHFELYEDVSGAFSQLAEAGVRVGLISNSHRCLESFQSHFALDGLVSATISSSDHGFMKPHPSIFAEALRLVDVPAHQALMVGDSMRHDVEGAIRAGMRAALLRRSGVGSDADGLKARGVPVITTLSELADLL